MKRCLFGVAATVATGAVLPSFVLAQACTPTFSERFVTGDVNSTIQSMLVFNDGSGSALYAAGSMTEAGGRAVNRIARWTSSGWEPLDAGLNSTVNALAVFDDGLGPALFAAGQFTTSPTTPATSVTRIARWTGSQWAPVGTGLANTVHAMTVWDEDGPGPGAPSLYVGGDFITAGGASAVRLARWDGAAWSPLGAGVDNTVRSLAVFDDGSGEALYIGGSFLNAGSAPANRIVKWDGTSYSTLGVGASAIVYALGVMDLDGPGGAPAELVASGDFTTIGGISANRIARWNGAIWQDMGAGLNGTARRIAMYDDGNGLALWVGGGFTAAGGATANRLARWDGAAWSAITPTGIASTVWDFVPFDDGRGERLYIGGAFTQADGQTANRIAMWNGEFWSGLNRGVDGAITAVAAHDAGAGQALYMAGAFQRADGIPSGRIVRFDGSEFSPLDGEIGSGTLSSLLSVSGTGLDGLFLGGSFTQIGGATFNRIARWDGSAWHPVMVNTINGLNGSVNDMIVWNDGSGTKLYITGGFSTAGGASALRVARWNGGLWEQVGGGLGGTGNAFAIFDDGSGEALYIGGGFTTAGGAPANRLARWDGANWSDAGGGLNNTVNDLAVFNDGTPKLYVGGLFTIAGTTSVNRIARWDGTNWLDVASGVNNTVNSMAVHDEDGAGPGEAALFVSGAFTTAGGATISRLARWDGSTWSPVSQGASEGLDAAASVMLSVADGPVAGLHMGGAFKLAAGQSSGHFATWNCQEAPCYANCDGSTIAPVLNVDDFTCFINAFASAQSLPQAQQITAYANCDGSLVNPVLNVDDFTCFINEFAQGCP